MAITTFAELQSAIDNWMDDTSLNARVLEAIALYEAAVNRRLRVRQQITSTSLTPSSGSATLPSDYLVWKRVSWTGSPTRELEYADPSYLHQAYPDSPSDVPALFTIEGSTLKIRPIDSTALTLVYAQKVPALSVSATTNWLLTAHPDYYLFGSLAAMETFKAGGSERMARVAEFDATVDKHQAELARLHFAHEGPAMIRPHGTTP
jgi:hypothetical protein